MITYGGNTKTLKTQYRESKARKQAMRNIFRMAIIISNIFQLRP